MSPRNAQAIIAQRILRRYAFSGQNAADGLDEEVNILDPG